MRVHVATVILSCLLCFGGAFPAFASGASPFDDSLLRTGRSYLGVGVLDLDAARANAHGLTEERGVEVVKVMEGSPAEKGGVKQGDILLSYNGEPILGAQQLGRLVWETPPNRHVKLQYWRDGKSQTTTVLIAEQDAQDMDPHAALKQLREQMPGLSMPADIPSALLIWRNRALGLDCEPLDSQLAEYFGVHHGILVRFVEKGSAGEKAGIRAGDILTSLGSRALNSPRDLTQCLRAEGGGKQVQISLIRDHKAVAVRVDVPAAPEQ